MRDTCICEIPICCAIWVCVIDSKNRMVRIRRSCFGQSGQQRPDRDVFLDTVELGLLLAEGVQQRGFGVAAQRGRVDRARLVGVARDDGLRHLVRMDVQLRRDLLAVGARPRLCESESIAAPMRR